MDKTIHSSQYVVFLQLLKQARLDAELSQVQLAERLETTQVFISKCERGERRLDFIETKSWLDALGVTFTEFVQSFEMALDR